MSSGKFCVIGLGNFGSHCAKELFELGNDVIALDKNRSVVNNMRDFVSQAIVADATKKDLLESLELDEIDAVIVSVGGNISTSILVTLYLKELGVKEIVVKALDDDHGRILNQVGATRIIFPEKDMAIKTAQVLSDPNLTDFIPLYGDYLVAEVPIPDQLDGTSLEDARLKRNYSLQVLAIKDENSGVTDISPDSEHILKKGELLTVLGRQEDVDRFRNL